MTCDMFCSIEMNLVGGHDNKFDIFNIKFMAVKVRGGNNILV